MPIIIRSHKKIKRPDLDLPIPPQTEGPRSVSPNHIPRPPDYSKEDDKILYQEQQTSRVEALMLKGYRDRLKIAEMLKLHPREVDDYIRRVNARWEYEGGQKHFANYRGEMVLKLRRIETEMWEAYEAAKEKALAEGKVFQVERAMIALSQIKSVAMARAEMLGLTKERIDRMMETEGEQNLDFKRKTEAFEQGARVASRLLDLVEERLAMESRAKREGRTIEHEPANVG